MSVKVAILTGFGINCDRETEAVFEMVGATTERIHLNHFVKGNTSLESFHILAIPGGFSFGDHLGSGRLLGNRLRFGLREQIRDFVASGRPIIGICNGFQVLVKMGLLPGDEEISLTQTASLTLNDSCRYEDRWVTLEFDSSSHCIWTSSLTRMHVPVRHGEGKFVTASNTLLDQWSSNGQLVCRYVNPSENYPSASDAPLPYPLSPNAAMRNIAGVCDPTGLVFGLMPHPEAYHSTWLGPSWTRDRTEHGEGPGLAIFHNAVKFIQSRF